MELQPPVGRCRTVIFVIRLRDFRIGIESVNRFSVSRKESYRITSQIPAYVIEENNVKRNHKWHVCTRP